MVHDRGREAVTNFHFLERRAALQRDNAIQPGARESGLRDLLAVLRQRLPIVLIAAVLVPAAAIAFSVRQPKQYRATAQLLFRDTEFDQKLFGGSILGPSRDPNREAATNVKLVSLEVIAARAATAVSDLGLTSEALRRKIQVVPQGQSDVVAVTATDRNPAIAARLANAVAREYIGFRRDADRSKITEAITLVRNRLKALTPTARAASEGESVNQRISQLEILASLQTGNAELVQRALAPDAPFSPRPVRDAILGLVAGVLLGLGLAMLVHRLDRRLRSATDAETIFGRPLLGEIPESRTLQEGGKTLHIVGPEAESFRTIRTNLRYFAIDQEVHSLLISSSSPGDGKSTTARYLAATASGSGARVILLEADLRRPTLRRLFSHLHECGLTNVLAGDPLSDAIQSIPVSRTLGIHDGPELHVITAGPVPPNPTDLLESERMKDVLRDLEARYDLVVVDTSPITVVPDAVPLLGIVSGVAIVVREGRTTKSAARALRKLLDNLAITPLGVISNGRSATGEGAYYGYYGYALDGDSVADIASAPERATPARKS